jgi:hypothetical protein
LEADACYLPRAVEAAAQFADAQWLAFIVLDEGQAGSGTRTAQDASAVM